MIYLPILINGDAKGFIAIRRSSAVEDNMGTDPAQSYVYDVEVNEGRHTKFSQTSHVYGDGTATLVRKAMISHYETNEESHVRYAR